MSLQALRIVATVIGPNTQYLLRFDDWLMKRDALAVLLQDMPTLVEAHKSRWSRPHPNNLHMTECDELPRIRLQSAIEGMTHTLYSLADIAAQFANRASHGDIPSSFNRLRQKVAADQTEAGLKCALGDLQWYAKVRELRTEWSHHSTVFIGVGDNAEPIFVVRCFRRHSDRTEFTREIQCTVPEVCDWTLRAIKSIDNLASYLLKKYIMRALDLDARFTAIRRDEFGLPRMTDDHKFEIQEMTVRGYLESLGVKPEEWL